MGDGTARTSVPVAPVLPTAGAIGRYRPLGGGDVEVTGGFWAERLRDQPRADAAARVPSSWSTSARSRTSASPPGRARGGYRALGVMFDGPFPFLDSDVYKWLEGVGLGARALVGRRASPRWPTRRSTPSRPRSARTATSTRSSRSWRPGASTATCSSATSCTASATSIQAAIAWHRALGDDRLLTVARRAADSRRPRPRARRRRRDRRPPRDRDGARRAVPRDRRVALPRARAPAHRPARPRPAGLRPVRRRATGRTPARPRGARRARATRSASCTSTPAPSTSPPRPATPPCSRAVQRALAGHGRDAVVPHRAASAAVTSRRRSATRTSCRRTAPTRRPARRSPASCSPGGCCSRPATPTAADVIERTISNGVLSGVSRDGTRLLLRQPAPATDAPGRGRGGHRRAQALVRLRLLPAERRADPRELAAAPRDDRRTTGSRSGSTRRARSGATAGGGDVRLAIETDYPWERTRPGDGRGGPGHAVVARRFGSRAGPAPARSTGRGRAPTTRWRPASGWRRRPGRGAPATSSRSTSTCPAG